MSDLLRHGRKVSRTLYLQSGNEPSDDDRFAGHSKTVEAADLVCAAIEGRAARNPRWWCSGGLIYPGPGVSLTRDWVIAVDDPDVAWRIVAAVRGEASRG